MPSCSLKQCGARKTKNQPQLSLHRFPKSEVLRRKWLEAIGTENINTRHSELFICSLHFEESQLNRTLDVTRLRENAVPTLFSVIPHNIQEQVLVVTNQPNQIVAPAYETPPSNIQEQVVAVTNQPRQILASDYETPSTSKHVPVLCEIGNMQEISPHMLSQPRRILVPDCETPTTSKHVPVLCEIGNMQEKRPPLMSQPRRFLVPDCETPTTSKHVPVLCEIGNLKEKMPPLMSQPRRFLIPDCETPSTSKYAPVLCETGNIQDEVLPMMCQTKENLAPAGKTVRPQSNKLQKLQKICDEQRKKIKRLNEKVRRQGKKIATLQDIITDLKRLMIINTEQSILLEQCGGSQDFLQRQIAKSKGLPLQKQYSEEIRKFALTLHFLSPKAYDFIRRVYNTCLPHPRTLSKWYQNVNADAGFTHEAFETLKKKVEQSRPQKLLCALTLDEISIRKGLTWDPKTLKYHGRVDYGHSIDCDSMEVASQCLVFLLTCINGSWKLPIGYFFITCVTGEQKSLLVETAIKLTEETGCQVVSVTCDGPAANFSMLSDLGCEISKEQKRTSFETPNKNTVHAFIDPCHAVKLIRNTLGDLRVLIDVSGRKIEFKYFELLLKLQEEQGLHLGTKVSKAHIFFDKQKMKVRLATQLLSNSVADALLYCQSELQMVEFQDCEGTVNFVNIVNNVFDVLNSHSIRPPGLKKAMCPENIGIIRALFESAIDYFRMLRLPSGELLVHSRRKTGFVGLIVDMKSALELYENVVEKNKILKYIPLYKVSQDHLELFFSAIRARGGFNNNPNAVQFRAAYKKLLVRAEIRDGGIGNCIPLEQVNILTCSSKNPVESINNLTEKNRFSEIEDDHSDLYDAYLEAMCNDTSKYKYSVLEYIAGFISRKLTKTIKCDVCLSLLSGPVNDKSLIHLKSRGGLVYASADVINIIKKTEYLLEHHLDSNKKPEHYYLYIYQFMVEFYGFDNEEKAFFTNNPDHDATHRVLLIKSVIKTFIDIRFRHHGKKATEKLSYRNYFNKLILFRNE